MPKLISNKKNIKTRVEESVKEIDATGKVLGRLASEVAVLLTGKNKTKFQRHVNFGSKIIIKNIDKIKLTGKKFEQKVYKWYSDYPGGLKINKLKDIFTQDPKRVFIHSVYYMLPKNRLRRERMKRLSFK